MNCWILLLLLSCCGNGCGNNQDYRSVGNANDGCGCHNHDNDCNYRSDVEAAERRAVKAVWEAKDARRDAREAVRDAKEATRDAKEAIREARDMRYDNNSRPSLRSDFNYNYNDYDYDNDCDCRN